MSDFHLQSSQAETDSVVNDKEQTFHAPTPLDDLEKGETDDVGKIDTEVSQTEKSKGAVKDYGGVEIELLIPSKHTSNEPEKHFANIQPELSSPEAQMEKDLIERNRKTERDVNAASRAKESIVQDDYQTNNPSIPLDCEEKGYDEENRPGQLDAIESDMETSSRDDRKRASRGVLFAADAEEIPDRTYNELEMSDLVTEKELPGRAPPRTVPNRRTATAMDLETGKEGGGAKHRQVLLRSLSSKFPTSDEERRWHRRSKAIREFLVGLCHADKNGDGEPELLDLSMHGRLQVSTRDMNVHGGVHGGPTNESNQMQYRLQAVKPERGHWIAKILGLGNGQFSIYEDTTTDSSWSCCGINPNELVMKYLHWSFRSTFAAVFLSGAVAFFCLVLIFSFLIWGFALRDRNCLGGVDWTADPHLYFMDAFQLSWTTFATVGYGLIYTGVSSTEPDIRNCTGMTIIVALEGFVGILFGSMCSAVMFAKVARIQSFAQVVFSDPIVVRYGSGVVADRGEDDVSDDDASSDKGDSDKIPCPVLEFRIVNRLNSVVGGEIIDASINIVASIDASQACPTVKEATKGKKKKKKERKGGLRSRNKPVASTNASENRELGALIEEPPPHRLFSAADRLNSSESVDSLTALATNVPVHLLGPTHQAFEEDPSGHLVPRRIFAHLEVESPEHPFFKRVWMVRHTLGENSPLLRAHAREMVKKNNGHWPEGLNSAEGVRASVHFDQILVSLSGTSNAVANSVYAQKVYDFVDMCVGYRFVNPLYRDETDGSLHVDTRLVNDVTEQAGGGSEPLTASHGVKLTDMLVL